MWTRAISEKINKGNWTCFTNELKNKQDSEFSVYNKNVATSFALFQPTENYIQISVWPYIPTKTLDQKKKKKSSKWTKCNVSSTNILDHDGRRSFLWIYKKNAFINAYVFLHNCRLICMRKKF